VKSAIKVCMLNRKSPVNITFSLFTLSFAASCFCLANSSGASSYEISALWYKVNIPFGIFLPGLALHFSMFLAGKNKTAKNPLVIFAIYILPVFFIIMMLFFGYFNADFKHTAWGWDSDIDYFSGYNWVFVMLYSLPNPLSVYYIWIWHNRAENDYQIKQASSLIPAYISGMMAIIFNPHFWYIEGHETLNFMLNMSSVIAFLLFLAGTLRAVNKFSFMKIKPESRIDTLINGIKDPAMITDIQGKIICCNKAAFTFISDKIDGSISNILAFKAIPETLRNSLIEFMNENNSENEAIYSNIRDYQTDRKHIVSVKKIFINDDKPGGLLWLIKEGNSISSFIEKYKVTHRQMEIINYILSGSSNKEISHKLGISERTVENHIFNIYNKTGVDNRVELFNTAVKYGIISHQYEA